MAETEWYHLANESIANTYIELNSTMRTKVKYTRMFEQVPRFMFTQFPVIVCILGVIFNIILITYFIKSGKYRSPTFTLLTSLAGMDLLTCAGSAGYAAFLFPMMVPEGAWFTCPFFLFATNGGAFGSEYHLVFFAALRLYQLSLPLQARARITPSFVGKGCAIIAASFLIQGIAFCVFYRPMPYVYHGEHVIMCSFRGNPYAKDVYVEIVATIFPCSAIVILHLAKYVALARNKSSIEVQQERRNGDARAVTIVIVLFLVTWFPSQTYNLIQQRRYKNYRNIDDNLYLVLMYCVFYNSCINPLIYCIAAKSVRDDILRLFGFKAKKQK